MRGALVAAAFLALLFATTAQGGFIKSGSIYTIQHKGGRDCGKVEWLGFFNRTCSEGTLASPYGPTAGPWLTTFRKPSDPSFKQYIIDVVGQAKDGNDLVTIKSYTDDGSALCEAYLTPEKEEYCKDNIWAHIAHIGHRQPYTWRIVPVAGDESYQIIAESRPAGCLKYLGASKACGIGNVTLFATDDGSRRQRWVIRESKGFEADAPPPPAKVGLAAPVITSAYPTGPTSGNAIITPSPGASKCILSSSSGETIFTPTFPTITVAISDLEPGVQDILTVICTNPKGVGSPLSNEAPITPPSSGNLVNTPLIQFIEYNDIDNYNITFLPPEGDSCTPTSYKVTYTTADGERKSVTVPASKPYGSAPTEVQLKDLELGMSYDVVCIGICEEADVPTTTTPLEISLKVPDTPAPPASPSPTIPIASPGTVPPAPAAKPSPPPPKPRSPPPPAPLGVPVIETAYPTGTTTGEVEFTPPDNVVNCTVYLNGTAAVTVKAGYPTTTANVTGLTPGADTIVSVKCEAKDGRVTDPSEDETINPPEDRSAPLIDDIVVPENPDDDFFITIVPPEGDCKPSAYNITYIPQGGNPRYYIVNANQPYGVAPTNFTTSFVPDTVYSLFIAGICQDSRLSPATEIDIDISPEEELGRPIIETVYPTRYDEADCEFTPPPGVVNCTVFVDGARVGRVPADYPTTTAVIADLVPGKEVIISVNCETDDGRTTNWSNEVSFMPPVNSSAPIIKDIVVPDTPYDPTMITVLPPDTGNCDPVRYNITYQSVGTGLAYIVVDAAQKYGEAPTRVFLTDLSADSEYTITVVGICGPGSKQKVTPPAEATLNTPGGDNLPDFSPKPFVDVSPSPAPVPSPILSPAPASPSPANSPSLSPSPASPAPGVSPTPGGSPPLSPAPASPAPGVSPTPGGSPPLSPAPTSPAPGVSPSAPISPSPVASPSPTPLPSPSPSPIPLPSPPAAPVCAAPNLICPVGTGNAGECVTSSLLCVAIKGSCTQPGGLCEPASGGQIKVCSKNNNCVSCSGTNPCPVNNPTSGGASSEFECVSGNAGGCFRRCRTQMDCLFAGLRCYSDTHSCDLPRAGPLAP